jgi:hypothetical protein
MPWELNIICRGDGEGIPLGARQFVIDKVAEALQGLALSPAPLPPPAVLERMPAQVRESFLKPQLRAVLETEDLSVEFWAPDAPVIKCLFADVRGWGNPVPTLARLCLPNGWSVIDTAKFLKLMQSGVKDAGSQALVDLTTPQSSAWEEFCGWRDQVIDDIQDPGENASGATS